jgi:putative oxidoreductase
MKSLLNLLRLNFVPHNVDAGLLLLRLWLGLSLLLLHGSSKLTGFSKMSGQFPDPLGVGSPTSLSLAVFAEVVCALLLVLGLFTRLAALILSINMAVAFFVVHKAALSGPGSGELAFIYLAGFLTLVIAGAGRFSLDSKLGASSKRRGS